jgi:hypothetical protein
MQSILSRYATPLVTGLFAVSLVSGVALFFHVGQAAFHGMHEWLSMVLILPFVLHLWKNWRAFLTYLRRPAMAVAAGLSLAAAIAFAYPAMTGTASAGGPPQFAILEAMGKAPLEAVAPALGMNVDALATKLGEAGYKVDGTGQTLDAVAKASGRTNREILGTIGAIVRG